LGCSERGFTLLEVLVVIAIIGLTATFVTMSVDDSRQATREIERLRLALESAAEQAEIRGTPVQVEFLPNAYRFSRFDSQGNWIPIQAPSILSGQHLSEGLLWEELVIDGRPASRRLVFGATVPQFVLRIRTSSGTVDLSSLPTGAVRNSGVSDRS
jgi:general secretion pathway protein H